MHTYSPTKNGQCIPTHHQKWTMHTYSPPKMDNAYQLPTKMDNAYLIPTKGPDVSFCGAHQDMLYLVLTEAKQFSAIEIIL